MTRKAQFSQGQNAGKEDLAAIAKQPEHRHATALG
jgi:hypothetical protein